MKPLPVICTRILITVYPVRDLLIIRSYHCIHVSSFVSFIDSSFICLIFLSLANASTVTKAEITLLHGRALDSLPSYSPSVEDLLSKAIKLDTTSYENWNALGHCFWKKRDYPSAVSCYTESQKRHPNAVALRSLSQLVRQASLTPESIQDSIAKAKAAIALNINDSLNWSTLGAAYLVLYIANSKNADDLIRAHKAYAKAAQFEGNVTVSSNGSNTASSTGSSSTNIVKRDPDMHYNRASVLQYLEDFDEAILAYQTAVSIDPGLQSNEAIDSIHRYLLRIHDLISKHAHIKPKKLRELANSLGSSTTTNQGITPLLPNEIKLIGTRQPAMMNTLQPGTNKGLYIRLKLLLPVLKGDQPPASAIVLDANNELCVLSLFHLGEKHLNVLGDKDKNTLLILDPIVKQITVKVPITNNNTNTGNNNTTSTTNHTTDSSSSNKSTSASTTASSSASSSTEETTTVSYSCIQVMHSDTFFVDGKGISSHLASGASGFSIEAFDR